MDVLGYEEIGTGHKQQYQHKQTARLVIKEQADEEQERIAQQPFAVYQAEDCKDNGKECPEIELSEKQRRILLKKENMFEERYQLLHSALLGVNKSTNQRVNWGC